MIEPLSLQDARKLVLLSQRVVSQNSGAGAATLAAIEHLGYIQLDSISVVQRAHHHTLWSRNPRYKASQLDQLLADKQVFEYWAHAAAYLPFCDYRFSLVRKSAFASGKQKHWYARDEKLMKHVLERIASEGPLRVKDFEHSGKKTEAWKAHPAKRALEYLFMQGDLMVPFRSNFQKVYDLSERVLPVGTDSTVPRPEEYARFLIVRYLHANGLGQATEISYLLNNTKALVAVTAKEMLSSGELLQVRVADQCYYMLPASWELLSKRLARGKLKILSPFDNLLIQRKRIKQLFGFDYLLECYLPEPKRRYGYFCLPILWHGKLVARMDCKREQVSSQGQSQGKRVLHIYHLVLEAELLNTDASAFFLALRKELEAFMQFNCCDKLRLHRTSPAKLKPDLQRQLNELSR